MRPMSLFPRKYLTAEDLAGVNHDVTIVKVVEGTVGDDEETRPIVFFKEYEKGLCLNVTNTKRIIGLYGDEDTGWVGKRITIYPSECDFKGDTVPCIRVKKQAPTAVDAPAGLPTPPGMTPEQFAQFQAWQASQAK